MRPVTVLILLAASAAEFGTPVGWLEHAREVVASRNADLFRDAGAPDIRLIREPWADRSFGERLRRLVAGILGEGPTRRRGLIVVGGGALPLARAEDAGELVTCALGRTRRAIANSFYSADVVAVSDARVLLDVPDLPSDNALPRWLAERAGIPVAAMRGADRLALDLDSPIDVLLAARHRDAADELRAAADAIGAGNPDVVASIEAVGRTLLDRRAEFLVAGRTSSRTVAWLEREARCRVRALIEERGMRAGSALALGDVEELHAAPSSLDIAGGAVSGRPRPPRSALGLVLDHRGPGALGMVVEELGDAAAIDTRVLLAHRLGPDESAWPSLADRLASDLLRPAEITDPWLREATVSALEATVPILLGGHTLVGPGLPLLLPDRPAAGV